MNIESLKEKIIARCVGLTILTVLSAFVGFMWFLMYLAASSLADLVLK